MFSKRFYLLTAALLVLLVALAACTAEPEQIEVVVTRIVEQIQEREIEIPVEVTVIVEKIQTRIVTEEVIVEAEMAPLGSEERPIKVLFVPSVEVDTIISGGELLADALADATGLNYEVIVPTSYAATIEEMCASPDDTIGFIPAQGYVLANDRCGVTVGASAVRFGLPWYAAQFIVRADSGIESLEDLAGKTWAIPDFGSTSGYLFPTAMFQGAGVETGDIVEAGSHPNAALAVYSGDVDFATTFFSPPLLPFYERQWQYGVDDPEIWREAGVSPIRNEEGRTFVNGDPADGGYRVLDARASVADTAPDIFDVTRILLLTDQIPNDSISFGPEFPLNTANQIISALDEWVDEDNPDCLASICSEDFYNWTGVDPTNDSFYDAVRFLMSTLGITEEDILGG
jgi:phosphonate transport system substrate-binding protein